MFLKPLHLPLISAGCFGGVMQRMLEFVSLRVRRSDQGMTPSLSPGLRAQTVALHQRLMVVAGEFQRLAKLARQGKLRVYPDRALPAGRAQTPGVHPRAARRPRPAPASPFGSSASVAQGPTLPALPTRGFGWMLGFMPAAHRDALAGLLRIPEMVALIHASSSVARLLRSLCNGLGVIRPKGVFLAPRRRQTRATPGSKRGMRRAHMDITGAAMPGSARPREPAIVMSPQVRDRWWAEHRRPGLAGDVTGTGVRFAAPLPGRCPKS